MSDRIKRLIEHPLHRYLGVSSLESESGRGRLTIKVTENIVNQAGAFHGGVIYLLCDVCAYSGLLSLLDEDSEAVTHDIHVSIMHAAKLGDIVVFDSEVVKRGRDICFIDVIVSLSEKIIASARVTKSILHK